MLCSRCVHPRSVLDSRQAPALGGAPAIAFESSTEQHAMNPEAGVGSGLGMGDAHALAVAIQLHPTDPDAALADYERWRRPAVAPYLAVGSKGVRVVRGGELRDEERWPPIA